MPVLTVIDTSGIQSYVFGSNRLRENIGASEIVARATTEWAYRALREGQLKDRSTWKVNLVPRSPNEQNVFGGSFAELDRSKAIENQADELDAEVVYAGGGNTLILFRDEPTAIDFTKRYTRFLLEHAPGLSVVVAHSAEFTISDDDNCVIREQLDEVMTRIDERKANRKLSAPLLGMAVTAKCTSTGGVASFYPAEAAPDGSEQRETLEDKYGSNYVSSETLAKLRYVEAANARLKGTLLNDNQRWADLTKNPHNLEVPYELDNLGRSEGEASYIAVVHTDGNGIGKRIEAVGKSAKTSREWITTMRSFSKEINDANLNALKAMLAHLLKNIQEGMDEKGNKALFVVGGHGEEFALSKGQIGNRKCAFLPLRPIIFGGEDVAFVCDGRIALALTAYYLHGIEKQQLTDPLAHTAEKKTSMYARAGIAIVKAHHPFARAYSLAEGLAKSAKRRIKEVSQNDQASALDWHLALTGLAGDVEEIRRREYRTQDGRELNMRPLSLRHAVLSMKEWRSYESFRKIITHFLQPEWREKRNKVKVLRDTLREGEKAVEDFAKLYRIKDELGRIEGYPNKGKFGWEGDVCLWFDAIEMLDLFYPLAGVDGAQARETSRAEEEGQPV